MDRRSRIDRRALLLGATATVATVTLLPGRTLARQATPAPEHAGHGGIALPEVELVRTAEGMTFPAEIEAGLNRVTMRNEAPGSFHAFVLRVPDAVSDDELAASLASEEPPAWFGDAMFAGNPDQAPSGGPGVSAVVHYPAGRYVIVNVFEGTMASFTASGNAWTRPAPVADVEIGLVDFAFLGLDAIAAGPRVWRITNHGSMWHDISLLRAPAGSTFDDLVAAAEADPATFPPAGYAHAGGVGAMSPGVSVWLEADLVAGTYVGACFLPTDDGQVHADLGMIAMIEVG